MSIRSYKDIYSQFVSLFPELAKNATDWKGVRFGNRHICITMKDGGSIHFLYHSSVDWDLVRCPCLDGRSVAKCSA